MEIRWSYDKWFLRRRASVTAKDAIEFARQRIFAMSTINSSIARRIHPSPEAIVSERDGTSWRSTA
jgi:hypothetical protein